MNGLLIRIQGSLAGRGFLLRSICTLLVFLFLILFLPVCRFLSFLILFLLSRRPFLGFFVSLHRLVQLSGQGVGRSSIIQIFPFFPVYIRQNIIGMSCRPVILRQILCLGPVFQHVQLKRAYNSIRLVQSFIKGGDGVLIVFLIHLFNAGHSGFPGFFRVPAASQQKGRR